MDPPHPATGSGGQRPARVGPGQGMAWTRRRRAGRGWGGAGRGGVGSGRSERGGGGGGAPWLGGRAWGEREGRDRVSGCWWAGWPIWVWAGFFSISSPSAMFLTLGEDYFLLFFILFCFIFFVRPSHVISNFFFKFGIILTFFCYILLVFHFVEFFCIFQI